MTFEDREEMNKRIQEYLDGLDELYGEDAQLRALLVCVEVSGPGVPSREPGTDRGQVSHLRLAGDPYQAIALLHATLDTLERHFPPGDRA